MSNEQKFYRTVIQIEVLSEGEYEPGTLESIGRDIDEGDCSGQFEVVSVEEVTEDRLRALLISQGSDPGFFGIEDEDEDE